MKKLKKKNLLSSIVFAVLLTVLLLVPVSCVPIKEPIQSVIINNDRFLREANVILGKLKLRTGATAAVLAIYDIDLTSRTIVASSGKLPETAKEAASTKLPGYVELLEVVNSGVTFYSTMDDLPEGLLKSDLGKSNIAVLVASPVYDTNNYLIGHVAIVLPKGNALGKERAVVYTDQAAAELTRLSGVLD
jgi:hypothetical protein